MSCAVYKLEAYLPESVRSYIHGKLNLLRIWLIQKGVLPDGPAAGGQESRLVTAAREAVESAAADLSAKSHELFNEQNELSKDYGPDDVFRSLKGKCMSTEAGEYEYELCWWEGATQKNRKGHGSTNMGNFAGLDYEEADSEDRADGRSLGKGRRMVLRYENGQSCWNGPQRKTDVWLACAEQDELWRVTETEKCVYKMEVGTPAACEDDATVQESGSEGKDEL